MSPRNESQQDLPEQNQDQRVQRHDEHPTRLQLHEPIVIIVRGRLKRALIASQFYFKATALKEYYITAVF